MNEPVPFLDAAALRALAESARDAAPAPCEACAALACPGWESMPGDFERARLRRVGTLRRTDADDEPTLDEHHPDGTTMWSPEAPIAPAHFPYNRCDAWRCVRCGRAFLRYVEYGGYYEDERIRALDPARLVDAPR